MPKRIDGPDWDFVRWHYGFFHRFAPVQNRPLVRMKGQENLPETGGFLYASNHWTWWDPLVLMGSVGRPVAWLAKADILESRFGKWFFGGAGCIPVDREAGSNPGAVKSALEALAENRIVGIFPEGNRGDGTATLRKPKMGVARLAMTSGAPVVPAGCLTDRFWPKGTRFPDLGETIYLNVGAPMKLEGDPDHAPTVLANAHAVMARIAALLDEARAARETKAKWAPP